MTADTAALRSMLDDAADRATFYGTRPGMVHLRPETVRALCDAADEVERLREEVSLARRIIDLDMRLHAPSASTAGCGGGIGGQMFTPHCPDYCEHPKHDADKALREDLLRDFYRLARTPLPERDASRTAHAALVADLRALVGGDELVSQRAVNPDEYTRRTGDRVPSYLAFYQGAADLAAVIRALLDRHAPEETT